MEDRVKLIVGNTFIASFLHILSSLKDRVKQDEFGDYIIVVPDKFSMNAERLLFETLGIDCTFNIQMTTLSRLIKKVLGDTEQQSILTKHTGTMLVSKIILQNLSKLSQYKKIGKDYNFAETMFNVINLLKSSGIKPDEIKNNFDKGNLGQKLSDIYLIYSEYEKSLSVDYLDAVTKLELFNLKVKTSECFKHSNIIFAMFDSFTDVQTSSLMQLAKCATSLSLCLCANTVQSNNYIYDNSTFQKIVECLKSNFIEYSIKNVYDFGTKMQQFLTNNLFAKNVEQKFETDQIKLVECDSMEQEIRYVASKIKYLAMEKSCRFDDISVAVNGLSDYNLTIERVFKEFSLPFFMDSTKTILEHYFAKTMLRILKFVANSSSAIDAVAIVQSPIFIMTQNERDVFENFSYKYNINNNEFFNEFLAKNDENFEVAERVRKSVFEGIKLLKEKFSFAKTVREYISILKEYLNDIDAKTNLIINSEQQGDIVERRIDEQVYQKVLDVLNECNNMMGDEKISFQFFVEMLNSGLFTINVSTVPLKVNALYVGDASESTFYPTKILFLIGTTLNRCPTFSLDAGTITDSEIEIFESNKQINPTIKQLNKREKFKIFNLIALPTNRLEITYSTQILGEMQSPSEFVSAVGEIIVRDGKKLAIDKFSQEQLFMFDGNNIDEQKAYFVGTIKNAIKIALSSNQNDTIIQKISKSALNNVLEEQQKKYKTKENKFCITFKKDVFFPHSTISISQIERYFSCPFKQFVDYGLRLKEQSKFEIRPLDIGIILHSVAKLFVDECIAKNFNNIDTDTLAKKYFSKTINDIQYYYLQKNLVAINSLKNEAIRFCRAIKYQIDSSEFKPIFTEKEFENTEIISGLTIKGFVDRVDSTSDFYRIIDYKTGSDNFNYTDLYYGIKIQLLIYLIALQKCLNKKPIGAMYMPISNRFDKPVLSEFARYKLSGVFLNEAAVLNRLDKKLMTEKSSDIVDVKFKADGTLFKTCENYAVSKKEFVDLIEYCIDLINRAKSEIEDEYILPKPFFKSADDNSCKYCKYNAICGYDYKVSGYRKITSQADKTKFAKGEK